MSRFEKNCYMNSFRRLSKPDSASSRSAESVPTKIGLGTGSESFIKEQSSDYLKDLSQNKAHSHSITQHEAECESEHLYGRDDECELIDQFISRMKEVHKHDVVNNQYVNDCSQVGSVRRLTQIEKKAVLSVLHVLTPIEGARLLCALLNVPCGDIIGALHCVFSLLLQQKKY